jgi:hypothetical protein
MERDLLEDFFKGPAKNKVVKIAEKAAKKRRPPNLQIQLNGTVENHRGYAIHNDFEDYFRKAYKAGKLKLTDWSAGRFRIKVGENLCEAGWKHDPIKYPEARFYEPNWEMEKQSKRKIETKKVRLGDNPFLKSLTEWPRTYAGTSPDKVVKVAAVTGKHDDWAAYYQTPWCGAAQVADFGNKLPEEAAAQIFPDWAKRLKWRP